MDDIENAEELRELEVQLYSQVHHEAQPEVVELPAETLQPPDGTSTETSAGNVASKRYWAQTSKPATSQHRKFVNPESVVSNAAHRSISKSNQSSAKLPAPPASAGDDNIPSSTEPKNSLLDSGATLLASGGGPEKKRGLNPFSAKNRSNKPPDSEKEQLPGKVSASNFMSGRMRKLDQNKKMQAKRLRSKLARQNQPKCSETIVLESSDEADAEVVLIPVSPPPIVTIDSSDDEKRGHSASKSTKGKQKANKRMKIGSRCNSPNSVMSDDFIAQQDKSRLLKEATVASDADLECTVGDAKTGSKDDSAAMEHATKFATPNRRVSKTAKSKPNYEVTQSNYRAVDVYESESSDMPESVYNKGKSNVPKATNKSYGSDVEEIQLATKTKKLRKRKASGSLKGSEPNDSSTDSENEGNSSATGLPYISRGIAVENNKRKVKRRSLSNKEVVNAADKEFINKLSNIVRGEDGDIAMNESHESNNMSEEDITARTIAEDVLNVSEKVAESDDVVAIPSAAMADLELMQVIDSISTRLDDYQEPVRHGGAATPELFFEDLTTKQTDEESSDAEVVENKVELIEPKEENKLDFMNVVYTNRDHVTWNDEMTRFYENSWGQERFNLDRILRLMDRTSDWSIKNSDKFPKIKRYSNLKCLNCCEFGHPRHKCPLPKKDIICYICGEIGHREPRCPNTLCLRCGKKSKSFTRSCDNCIVENTIVCPICKVRGHTIDLCPDKWRRYHSTTAINQHPNSNVVYSDRKLCCICAARGHTAEQCRSPWRLSEYYMPTSQIKSHSKTYNDIIMKNEIIGGGIIGVHLMSSPNEKIEFPFTKKVTKHQFYGRFLSAVGLYTDQAEPMSRVKNYVVNPFAKDIAIERMKKEKKMKKGEKKSKRNDENEEDIQLNITGQMESDAAEEVEEETVPSMIEESETKEVEESIDVDKMELADDEKVEETDEKIDQEKEAQPTADKSVKKEADTAIMDSDSNYSFSEHFPKPDSPESPRLVTGRKARTVGPLPDFIPLGGGSDEEDADGKPDQGNKMESGKEEMVVDENEGIEESEAVCGGKIYLSKFHSKFLLSAGGTKFLVESSKKHDIKASMDWTAVGNVLVLEGLPQNQDKFHKELMEVLKQQSEEKSRNELEQSQKVPRKREALIKFLQDNILLLVKDLGNPVDLNRKMKFNQNHYTRMNFKAAERNRRLLNMILIGKAGFREGRMHLSILQELLAELQSDDQVETVPNELRDKIEKHWRYIFSSVNHCNYDQMVRHYVDLKEAGNIPRVELNYKLLGKNVLDVEFNEEQKELLMQPPPPPKIVPSSEIKTPRTEFGVKQDQQKNRSQQISNSSQKGEKSRSVRELFAPKQIFDQPSPFQKRLNLSNLEQTNFEKPNMLNQLEDRSSFKNPNLPNRKRPQSQQQNASNRKQQQLPQANKMKLNLECPEPPEFVSQQFFHSPKVSNKQRQQSQGFQRRSQQSNQQQQRFQQGQGQSPQRQRFQRNQSQSSQQQRFQRNQSQSSQQQRFQQNRSQSPQQQQRFQQNQSQSSQQLQRFQQNQSQSPQQQHFQQNRSQSPPQQQRFQQNQSQSSQQLQRFQRNQSRSSQQQRFQQNQSQSSQQLQRFQQNQAQSAQQQQRFQQNQSQSPQQQPDQRFSRQKRQNPQQNFVANKLREINNKWDGKMNDILTHMVSPPVQAKQVKHASVFWSRECLKFLGKSMCINNLPPIVEDKLFKLTERASKNMLSFNDFKAIKKIYLNLLPNDVRRDDKGEYE